MKKIIMGSVLALALSNSMYAEEMIEEEKASNMGLKVGTLGVGVDFSTAINETMAIRLNLNGATYSRSELVDDINYDGTLKFLTAGALLDYYPGESSFRLTAGAYYNNNKFDLVAKPALTDSIKIGDISYTGAEVGQLNANVTFNKIAPYIGLGWGNKPTSQKGWGFTFDLGAMYQGAAIASAEAVVNNALPQLLKTQIVNDVEKERQKIEDDMGSYTWYPVIMIGVNYTF